MKQIGQGFILKRTSYSDSSVILTLYTRNGGLQKFIFQGGKKKAAALYPLSWVEFSYYKRPDSELGKLTAAEPLNPASEIPFDPIRTSIAFFLAEVVLQCCKTEDPDLQLYERIVDLLERLEAGNELSFLPVIALVDLTFHLGINPQISGSDPQYFILEDGEINTAVPLSGTIAESGEHVRYLAHLLNGEKITVPTHDLRTLCLSTMIRYYECYIPGFNVRKSLDILKETLA